MAGARADAGRLPSPAMPCCSHIDSRAGSSRTTTPCGGRRRHEIGVGTALGATRGDTIRLMMRQGLTTTALGIVAGIGAALALTRVMQSLLYGVEAAARSTFIVLASGLGIIALLASGIPAVRAALLDLVKILREG